MKDIEIDKIAEDYIIIRQKVNTVWVKEYVLSNSKYLEIMEQIKRGLSIFIPVMWCVQFVNIETGRIILNTM